MSGWSGVDGWKKIGGVFPADCPVTAVSREPDQLDLFVCGKDGRVYTSWWHQGGDWSGINDNWGSIGGSFAPGSKVAAVARKPDQLDVFVCGNDGSVYTSWWTQGSDWSGWKKIGGVFPAGCPVAAVSRNPDQLDLFISGKDGHVYTSWWHQGSEWSGIDDKWGSIGGSFLPGSEVSAVARKPNQLDVFVCGKDGHVYTAWWTEGGNWSSFGVDWESIGGSFHPGSKVAAVARKPNILDVFACGNDGSVYTSWWTG
ncbi:hypothetical protein GP486_006745 [Trichoglossum hirsutum]|uniref:PLL-like beta propeller domain-containing protein n=1 Tax=Trichoglossum hirsutum TaxID=265104 RepID=A0A9P8IIB4_9PEZI|nr:hypothetical protein GP486_006745 [Trichoglossum hirsutum]